MNQRERNLMRKEITEAQRRMKGRLPSVIVVSDGLYERLLAEVDEPQGVSLAPFEFQGIPVMTLDDLKAEPNITIVEKSRIALLLLGNEPQVTQATKARADT